MKNPFRIRRQELEMAKDTLFLNSSALQVGVNSGQLEVRDGKEPLGGFPLVPLKRVVVIGNPQITTQAVKACLSHGVSILYHDIYGGFLGMTDPPGSGDPSGRIAQYRLAASEERRIRWAKALIAGKIRGAQIEFRRMVDNGWHPGNRAFNAAMRKFAAELDKAASTGEIFGVEGSAAREYFEAFAAALPPGVAWRGRQYRPAADPVNALLSFTYGLAKGRLEAECRFHGLDSALCFLHRNGYGSGGLATDLVEPFRCAWCDHQVLWALRHGEISAGDFVFSGGACRLSAEGREKYMALSQRQLLPRMDRAMRGLFAAVLRALADPESVPDFSASMPER